MTPSFKIFYKKHFKELVSDISDNVALKLLIAVLYYAYMYVYMCMYIYRDICIQTYRAEWHDFL